MRGAFDKLHERDGVRLLVCQDHKQFQVALLQLRRTGAVCLLYGFGKCSPWSPMSATPQADHFHLAM